MEEHHLTESIFNAINALSGLTGKNDKLRLSCSN
jgi:hypothetical protein